MFIETKENEIINCLNNPQTTNSTLSSLELYSKFPIDFSNPKSYYISPEYKCNTKVTLNQISKLCKYPISNNLLTLIVFKSNNLYTFKCNKSELSYFTLSNNCKITRYYNFRNQNTIKRELKNDANSFIILQCPSLTSL